ncbi:MAG: hypothetical protein IANPNBLG_00655 [Bryobacteraceae bacterium]|nr:hypothetical protein [Bryobacteraceae bacterium]
MTRLVVLIPALALIPSLCEGQVYGRPKLLQNIGIDQKMGARVPADLTFADEQGKQVTLGQYLGKPVILALVYYTCPSLCNMVLRGTVRSVHGIPLTAGKEYNVVAVSFDPRETFSQAAAKKEEVIRQYGRPGAESGWHFLTGSEGAINTLAASVGFRFAYDSNTNQFVHPSCIIVLTPEGRVARYFYGISYPERDVRLGLVEASGGKIGSPVDQVLLYCFHYDPANGKYGFVIMSALRAGGVVTAGLLFGFMIIMFRRDAKLGRSGARRLEAGNG